MVHGDQEVVIVGGTHALHQHEKLSVAVSKAMRGHSVHETKNDGRFHVQTKTYVDGAILKEVCFSFIIPFIVRINFLKVVMIALYKCFVTITSSVSFLLI